MPDELQSISTRKSILESDLKRTGEITHLRVDGQTCSLLPSRFAVTFAPENHYQDEVELPPFNQTQILRQEL
jgi:hypothetical protein